MNVGGKSRYYYRSHVYDATKHGEAHGRVPQNRYYSPLKEYDIIEYIKTYTPHKTIST